MKKLLTMLMVASIFSLVACGPSEEEQAKAEADAKAMVEDMFDGMEETAAPEEEVVAEEEVATEEEAPAEEATEEEAPAE